MAVQTTGFGIFFGAIKDLQSHSTMVLRIVALPLVIYLLIEIALTRAYVTWFNSEGLAPGLPEENIGTVSFFALLGILASSWHRFMILGQHPRGLRPDVPFAVIWRYVLAWIVIGIIVALIVLVGFLAPLFLVGSLIDPLFGEMLLQVIIPDPYTGIEPGTSGYVIVIAVCVLTLFVYLYLLFRMGIGMRSVAVREDRTGMGIRASWRVTRALARPLLGVAALATVGQTALSRLSWILLGYTDVWDGDTMIFADEYPTRVQQALFDTVITLIGAAVLTRIYRAVSAA